MRSDPERDLELLLREEPYVRELAGMLAVDRANADEIVQQTWLQAIEHGGSKVEKPRSWLGRIVRNVAKNFARGERRQRARERRFAESSVTSAPSSAELTQREERRRQLVEFVDCLPADQREVVLLRYFEGLPPRTIAQRLGLPVGTVWNLQRRGLERLRRQLDGVARRSGLRDRRAWLGVLMRGDAAPTPTNLTPAGPAGLAAGLFTGVIAMTTKTKLLAAVAALVALAVYAAWPPGAVPDALPGQGAERDMGSVASAQFDRDAAAPSGPETAGPQREQVASPGSPVASTGTLLVRAFHAGEERVAAAGATLSLRLPHGDARTARRVTADASGEVTFADLPPGRVYVWGDRFGPTRRAEIVAGETTEFELVFPVGMTIHGRVVDPGGLPIAGALIDLAKPGLLGRDPETVAVTDASGEFVVRSAADPSIVGARAGGYVAAPLQYVTTEGGQMVEVELQLKAGGGSIAGLVVDHEGRPVADTLVCIGAGKVQGMFAMGQSPVVLPALVRSDKDGRFRAVGIAAGDQPVWARSAAMAPWRGTCVVASHATTTLRIDMQRGAVLRGVVMTPVKTAAARGASAWGPVAGAEIEVGNWGEAEHTLARSVADGSFEMIGLPGGDVEIDVDHDEEGKATQVVALVAGAVRTCEVRLSRGLELRGKVTTADQKAVAEVYVQVSASRTKDADRWSGFAQTDEGGNFAVANCPHGRTLTVEFGGGAIEPHRRTEVDPRHGDLRVQVQLAAAPSVYIKGVVVGPDGLPMAGASVRPNLRELNLFPTEVVTEADGAFEFGPLVAGKWRLWARRRGMPSVSVEERELAAGARWDVGEVRFVTGGTAVLRSQTVPMTDLRFMISATATGKRFSILADRDEPETPVFASGEYRLMVWGRNAAAQMIPFTIQSGQETTIDIDAKRGVRQRLEYLAAEGADLGSGGTLKVYRGDEQLVDSWQSSTSGEPWHFDLWLLPGTYRITMAGPKLHGEVTVTVGAQEPAPVQVRMQ